MEMAGKRGKPQDVVLKLRQIEVPQGQRLTVAEAVHQTGVTQQTFYRGASSVAGLAAPSSHA